MPTPLLTVRDSLLSGLTAFMSYLPTLVGAILVVAAGWVVSGWVARLSERVLRVARLDQVSGKAGVDRFLVGPSGRFTASHGVGVLAKWFVRLVFLQAAANLLNMPQVTAIINSILLFIPNVAVAMVILVIGAYASQFVSGLVRESVSKSGTASPELFAMLTRYGISGFAVIAALNHLGIAVVLVNTLFIGLVASLSLAIGLAFGLGGRAVAAELTQSWYARANPKIKAMPSSEKVRDKAS